MVDFNKLKNLGTELLGKATELAEQAKEKAGPLAEQAKEKAGPLAGKAKDAAAKGFDKAADGIDSATGGKYSDKIDNVQSKVGGALHKDAVPPVVPVTDPIATGAVADPIVTPTVEPTVITGETSPLTESIYDKVDDGTDVLGGRFDGDPDKAEPASPTV